MTSVLREREGVGQNMTKVLIGCLNGTVTRGGGGPKNPKILRTSFKYRPLWAGQLLGYATLPSPGDHIGNESEGRLQ